MHFLLHGFPAHQQREPFAYPSRQTVASDKTHCEPYDWLKTNQWDIG